MRLTFPGATTSMLRLVALLTFVFLRSGARPVRRLDIVLVQAIAQRTGVELQQAGAPPFLSPPPLPPPPPPSPAHSPLSQFPAGAPRPPPLFHPHRLPCPLRP